MQGASPHVCEKDFDRYACIHNITHNIWKNNQNPCFFLSISINLPVDMLLQ